MPTIKQPAPRPCDSCPYRRDVPPGVWAAAEYAKLAAYDAPTGEQPTGVFQCHQNNHDSTTVRVCAGWAGTHDTDHLLSLRMAVAFGSMTPQDVAATRDYVSPVPLFESGTAAAQHGIKHLGKPGTAASRALAKIEAVRDLSVNETIEVGDTIKIGDGKQGWIVTELDTTAGGGRAVWNQRRRDGVFERERPFTLDKVTLLRKGNREQDAEIAACIKFGWHSDPQKCFCRLGR